uniref:Uncharacterized protein n=1 Tax=Arundo donax TaxID=35708 RepID=A0A0A9FNZ4_ARUDO
MVGTYKGFKISPHLLRKRIVGLVARGIYKKFKLDK